MVMAQEYEIRFPVGRNQACAAMEAGEVASYDEQVPGVGHDLIKAQLRFG